jgi:hypothetical protein
LLDSASGDINKDGIRDLVMVLKNKLEENKDTETTRPLLLLVGNGKGLYRLFARNDSVVLCKQCGGFDDPYQGISIKKGVFSINHYGGLTWKWTRIITFRYNSDKKQFILYRDAGISFASYDPDKTIDIFNNKERFNKVSFSMYSNKWNE